MNVDPYILAFSAFTVIVTIWMGFRSAKTSKTASDFFVAGRSVSVGWNASAISGEYLSAASFMGIAGMVMSSGYDALWYPVCYACGYLFLLLFIAGPLRRFGAYTIPDFAEGRFDSPLFRKIAVCFVLFIGFFYTMPQMKGAGVTLAYIFPGLPYWAGVVLVGAVITLNVALGGMKGITLVQAFQYWAKMFAISVPIFVLMAVYGHYGRQLGANANSQRPTSNIQRLTNANPVVTTVQIKIGNTPNELIATNGYVFISGSADNDIRSLETGLKQGVANIAKELADDVAWKTKGGVETSNSFKGRGIVDGPPSYVFTVAHKLSSFAGGRPVLISDKLDFLTNYGQFSISYTSSVDRVARTERWLTDRGVAVVRSEREFKLVPMALKAETEAAVKIENSKLSIERSPLPEKAPTDSVIHSDVQQAKAEASEIASLANLPDSIQSPGMTSNFGVTDTIIGFEHKVGPARVAVSQGGNSGQLNLGNVSVPLPLGIARTVWSNGIAASDARIFGRSESGNKMRKPLPEKAPADSIWLSPFGPLTTKAAKAAKILIPSGELATRLSSLGYVKDVYPVVPPNSVGQAAGEIWGKAGPNHLTYGLPGTNAPIRMMLNFCISNRLLGFSEVGVYLSPELTNKSVSYPPGLAFGALNFRTALVEILKTNGVRLEFADSDRALVVSSMQKPSPVVLSLPEKSIRSYSLLYTYSLIIALVCGTAGLPHILVRFYTNPDGVAAKRTTMWVMILIGIFYVFPPVFGVMGRNLMPELYTGLSGIKGTDQVVLKLPTLLNEKFGVLGSILSGVTCAGAFAAFMSTFSGLLVSMTGAMAHDVYGRILKPKATAEERLRMFKIAAVLIGGVAILLGSFVEPLEINFMVGQAFAIAAASYFPLLFMSVWWRGMTMKGAAVGMLTGGLCALTAATLTNVSNLALDKGPMGKIFSGFAGMNDFWAQHPLLRILCEQPAIWTVPLAIGLMIVVSKTTRKDVPSDVRMKMLVLHAPEKLGLKQEYIQEHQPGH